MLRKILGSFLIFFIIFGIILYPRVSAFAFDNLQSGETIFLGKEQTINSDYFAAGETVNLAGTVNGDAYLAGGKINVDGLINGDLLVAGGTINIRGEVLGNIRSAGGDLTISGKVGRNISLAGGSINLTDSAQVGGNAVIGGGDLNIYSPIRGDLTVGAGSLVIGNEVAKNVYAGVGNFTLASSAKVMGDINYWSDTDGRVEQGAQIAGKTTRFPARENPSNKTQDFSKFAAGLTTVYRIISLISALIIGLLMVKFLPNYTKKTADLIVSSPGKVFLVGLLALILTPAVVITLLITIVGIPLSFMLLASFLILVYLAKVVVAIVIGQKLLGLSNKTASLSWSLVIGLIIYAALTTLPFVGGLVSLLVVIFGIGGMLIERHKEYQILRSKKAI